MLEVSVLCSCFALKMSLNYWFVNNYTQAWKRKNTALEKNTALVLKVYTNLRYINLSLA